MLPAVVKAARPHQWVKNLFVAAPLVFAMKIAHLESAVRTLAAVASFCLVSSAVYFINDIVDVDKDRAHPKKRFRAIASGALSLSAARKWAVGLAAVALGGGLALGPRFAAVAAAYLALNLAYSFLLKRVPFIDVATISLGFLLRVLGGAVAIPVPPSGWLLGCTALLASFLGFGKRAHELRLAGEKGGAQRDVLERYDESALRTLLIILGAATVATYAAYTQSAHALGLFGTRHLAFTVPFVVFGIGRFLWLTLRSHDSDSPTDSMLSDRVFLLNLALYALSIVVVLYRDHMG